MKLVPILLIALVFAGCTAEKPIGGDKDEHGCLIAAGYSWCEEKGKCLRIWEEPCQGANTTANATVYDFESCAASGNPIMESYPRQCAYDGQTYREEACSSGTDILTLSDAVGIAKASECGDRLVTACDCPQGYVKDGLTCNPSCYYSEPKCLAPSIECERSYVCNEGTGTYWIDMSLEKEGCSPACVVYLANRTAEINWRCTGLIPK
ncbi:MAG: hypothetical protein V1827_02165 [Candidatus Micrarchaeota archaeon]